MTFPRLAALLALPFLAGCETPPLAPRVEAGGEPGTPVYRASGAFTPLSYSATGRASYVLDAEGRAALSLSADFTVPAVPGVAIFLSDSPDLERAVKVGELEGSAGPRRWTFQVPRGAAWEWAVLWSEALRVGVALAHLREDGGAGVGANGPGV